MEKINNNTQEQTPKKTTLKQIVFVAKIIGVLCLAPVMFAIFTADRFILVFLPHLKQETIQESFKNLKHFVPIIYRVGFILLVIILIQIWQMIF